MIILWKSTFKPIPILPLFLDNIEESELLDARDFENVDKVTKTYAGYERDIIDILRDEIDKADYLE